MLITVHCRTGVVERGPMALRQTKSAEWWYQPHLRIYPFSIQIGDSWHAPWFMLIR